ncbi:MAG: ribosome biogenesis factor YjgA [Kofleriaceae bacterium]
MPASDDDNDSRSKREIKRSKMRRAGDRSADLARKLMELPETTVKKLDVDEALRDAIDRARRIESHIARRRAERTLAGDLRRFEDDLPGLEDQLEKIEETGNPDAQLLHLGEQLRTQLIAGGKAAAKGLPPGDDAELERMISAAQKERDTGKPPGAARALFRHVVERLKTQRVNARLAASETDDA